MQAAHRSKLNPGILVRAAIIVLAALSLATSASAQGAPSTSARAAFAVEATGGTLGSLAGIGFVAATNICDTEEIGCVIGAVSLSTAVGAALGTYTAGRAFGTRPSTAGAVVGAAAGALAGAGVLHLATEELGIVGKNGAGAWLSYSVTQGAVTALGSRLARRLRRRGG